MLFILAWQETREKRCMCESARLCSGGSEQSADPLGEMSLRLFLGPARRPAAALLLAMEPGGGLPPEGVAEALAEEAEVSDLTGADVGGGQVAVGDVGAAVGVEETLDGRPRRVRVVREAVGEERTAEAREAVLQAIFEQVARPAAPARPLAGDSGRKVFLGAEGAGQVAEEAGDHRHGVPLRGDLVARGHRPVRPPAALRADGEEAADPPARLGEADDLAAGAVAHDQQLLRPQVQTDPVEDACEIELSPVAHPGAEAGEARRPRTADPAVV